MNTLLDRLHDLYAKAENYDGSGCYISGLLDGIDAAIIVVEEYLKEQEIQP